jgi:molybdopterin-guanine dinucleotide biosynthesis protein A
VIGVVLAGGRGRRLGARSKAAVALAGRPLISYPLAVLTEISEPVAVVCKADTVLPPLPAVARRWEEPHGQRHPAVGIAHSLDRTGGPVLVVAADMPFLTVAVCHELLSVAATTPGAPAVVAESGGRLQPVLGIYRPDALPALRAAGDGSLTAAVEALGPALVEVASEVARSVNTPDELAAAERELGRGRGIARPGEPGRS